jgi:hypothetical protein
VVSDGSRIPPQITRFLDERLTPDLKQTGRRFQSENLQFVMRIAAAHPKVVYVIHR